MSEFFKDTEGNGRCSLVRWALLPVKIPIFIMGLIIAPFAISIGYAMEIGEKTWDEYAIDYIKDCIRIF